MIGAEYVITKGKLINALIASAAVPGLLPPVKFNGRWLVDGDIAHCNPVALIRKKVDKVIYVDVMTEIKKIKIKKLNIIKTLVYSFDIKKNRVFNEIKKRKDTVVIKPQVDGSFNFLNFHEYNKFILEGEKATKGKIMEIKKLLT